MEHAPGMPAASMVIVVDVPFATCSGLINTFLITALEQCRSVAGSSTQSRIWRSYDVNRHVSATVLSALLACLVAGDVTGVAVSAQSRGNYKVDANWARLPAGATWNGNTSW